MRPTAAVPWGVLPPTEDPLVLPRSVRVEQAPRSGPHTAAAKRNAKRPHQDDSAEAPAAVVMRRPAEAPAASPAAADGSAHEDSEADDSVEDEPVMRRPAAVAMRRPAAVAMRRPAAAPAASPAASDGPAPEDPEADDSDEVAPDTTTGCGKCRYRKGCSQCRRWAAKGTNRRYLNASGVVCIEPAN